MANKQYISIIRLFHHCEIHSDENFNISRAKKQLQAEFGIAKEGFVEVEGYSYTRHDVFEELDRPDFLSRLTFHKSIWQSTQLLEFLENNSADLTELEKELEPFTNNPEFDAFFSPYFAGPFNINLRSLLTALNLEQAGELLRYEAFLLSGEREEAFRPIRLFLDENFMLLRNVNGDNYKLMRPKISHWIDSDWYLFFNNLPHEFYEIKGDITLRLVNIGVAIQKSHRRDCKKMSQQLVSLQEIPEHLRNTITSNHLIYNGSSSWSGNVKGGAWVGWIVFMILRGVFSNGCNDRDSHYVDPTSFKIEYPGTDTFFKLKYPSADTSLKRIIDSITRNKPLPLNK